MRAVDAHLLPGTEEIVGLDNLIPQAVTRIAEVEERVLHCDGPTRELPRLTLLLIDESNLLRRLPEFNRANRAIPGSELRERRRRAGVTPALTPDCPDPRARARGDA